MNDKNKALFFDEDNEYAVSITLTDENGKDFDASILAAIEIEELHKEFIAVLPEDGMDDMEPGEALILEYSEDANGDPVFAPIEDEEIFEIASDAFNQFFEDVTIEIEENPDAETDENDYLNSALPKGVSVRNN